jgi:hypothetical protein
VLVIPGTVALGILAAASLAHHSIMSSFFCCAVKPLNQALAVCVFGILGRNHSPGFIRVRIHAASSLYSGCEDLLSVHFTEPTYLYRTAFCGRRFASGLLIIPSNDSAMVLIFSCLYLLFI